MSSLLEQPPSQFQFRRVNIGAVTLHVAEIGKGAPTLFLHGFPEYWRAFAPMMTQLCDQFRCIAPDQRGYNLSDRPHDVEAYHIDKLADDVAVLIETLGLGRVNLVAHDWGGVVAWHFAGKYYDLLDRLVIFNAPHPFCLQHALDTDPVQRAASTYAARFAQHNSEQDLESQEPEDLWTAFFSRDEKQGWLGEGDKKAMLDAWAQPDAWRTMLNWYKAAGFDYSGANQAARPIPPTIPPKIKAETLLVWGAADPLFAPSCLTGLSDIVDALTLKTIQGGGHAVFREDTVYFGNLVRAFLTAKSQ